MVLLSQYIGFKETEPTPHIELERKCLILVASVRIRLIHLKIRKATYIGDVMHQLNRRKNFYKTNPIIVNLAPNFGET